MSYYALSAPSRYLILTETAEPTHRPRVWVIAAMVRYVPRSKRIGDKVDRTYVLNAEARGVTIVIVERAKIDDGPSPAERVAAHLALALNVG
jgi:hypothetical protein